MIYHTKHSKITLARIKITSQKTSPTKEVTDEDIEDGDNVTIAGCVKSDNKNENVNKDKSIDNDIDITINQSKKKESTSDDEHDSDEQR